MSNNVYELFYLLLGISPQDREDALNEYMNVAIEKEDYSFETGLLGGGWLIALCANKGFMIMNVDEVLFDLDDNLYKIAIKIVTTDKINIDELLYFITYYRERIKNRESKHNFFRNFSHHEILKLLVLQIKKWMKEANYPSNNLLLTKAILILTSLFHDGFNESKVEDIFYEKMEYLIEQFESKKRFDKIDLESLYYLLFSAKQYRNPFWIEKIERLISNNFLDNDRMYNLRRINQLFLQKDSKKMLCTFWDKNLGELGVFCSINLFILYNSLKEHA